MKELGIHPSQEALDVLIQDIPFVEDPTYDVYDQIPEVGNNIIVVERRRWERDNKANFQCAQFAFGQLNNEPWAQIGRKLPDRLWTDGIQFLTEKGYQMVGEPEPSDIVGYAELQDDTKDPIFLFRHFGKMTEDGMVVSKWNQGHIYRHAIEEIPLSMGNTVGFFRRYPYEA